MNTPPDDFVITLKPDATPEQEDRFLTALAFVLLAIARSLASPEALRQESVSTDSDLPSDPK